VDSAYTPAGQRERLAEGLKLMAMLQRPGTKAMRMFPWFSEEEGAKRGVLD